MKLFADLLERLAFTPSRLGKLALLRAYFTRAPDPDRGYALAAIAGTLRLPAIRPNMVRALAATRTDPTLFAWSYEFVGDLAETVALLWPGTGSGTLPGLSKLIETLAGAEKSALPAQLATWLDAATIPERYALLKLITSGLRVGVSARLAKTALAELATPKIDPDEIEEIWHALAPPYLSLFAWLEGRAPRPDPGAAPIFRPPMLAHPLTAPDRTTLDLADHQIEWKWDGIRVQLVATPIERRLYSRGSEDISTTFPEILLAMNFHGVLDGELLVIRNGDIAPFGDLQQRLNRRTISARHMTEFPTGIYLYDILFDGRTDLRALPLATRRQHLEAFLSRHPDPRLHLSPLIELTDWPALDALWASSRASNREGLMLKQKSSPYLAGRPKGNWWKWKRDPLTIDAVLMYAERGHGKRGGTYSDYTFGVWSEDGRLVPVGKAYSGYTDKELVILDRFIRTHTLQTFGPVREVEKTLVLEIAFDAAQSSTRHKSGIALRFPRINRLRPDKPASEADRLTTLQALITAEEKK